MPLRPVRLYDVYSTQLKGAGSQRPPVCDSPVRNISDEERIEMVVRLPMTPIILTGSKSTREMLFRDDWIFHTPDGFFLPSHRQLHREANAQLFLRMGQIRYSFL